MEILTTNGIEVSVETFFQPDYSRPVLNKIFFAYQIRIKNLNPFTVQLLGRYWQIVDSNGQRREVEGRGVVGQQPILKPLETHTYVSGCPLQTAMGRMWGYYTFVDLSDQKTFQVTVPEFSMVAPFKMN